MNQFSDKYDLIAWDYVQRTTTIMDKVGIDEYRWRDTLYDGALTLSPAGKKVAMFSKQYY